MGGQHLTADLWQVTALQPEDLVEVAEVSAKHYTKIISVDNKQQHLFNIISTF